MERVFKNICPDREFFGREREISYISARAQTQEQSFAGLYLCGKRWVGKSEVLKRACNLLYSEQSQVAPIYYRFGRNQGCEQFAEDYLKEVVKQFIAFLKRDLNIARREVSLAGLRKLIFDAPGALECLDEFITRHMEHKKTNDRTALLKNALSLPQFITERTGRPVFLLLDDLDHARTGMFGGGGEEGILGQCLDMLFSGAVGFVASGSTKRIIEPGSTGGALEVLALGGLDHSTSVEMMINMCRDHGVEYDSDTLTLGAELLAGNPMYIKSIIRGAAAASSGCEKIVTLRDFFNLYVDEVTEGSIAVCLRSLVALKDVTSLRALYACANSDKAIFENDLADRLGLGRVSPGAETEGAGTPEDSDLIEKDCGILKWVGDDVSKDFVNYIYARDVLGVGGEEARTELLLKRLKQGFFLQGQYACGRFAADVTELASEFDGQVVGKRFFRALPLETGADADEGKDKDKKAKKTKKNVKPLNGQDEEEGTGEGAATDNMTLPRVAGCFEATRWEGDVNDFPILIVRGFQGQRYDEGNEVSWLVWIKQDLTTVSALDVEGFIKRTVFLTEKLKGARVVRWMVALEGFSQDALTVATREGIWSSSGAQLRALKELIAECGRGSAGGSKGVKFIDASQMKEFELVLPISNMAELVAVRAISEIAGEMGFGDDAIAQIKAALVEACINAFEHSKVRNASVRLRFVVGSDRLSLHVQSSGRVFDGPFTDEENTTGAQEHGKDATYKRGRGIEIMKGLMDTVKYEKLMGGTKLVMVKLLDKEGSVKL